MKWKKMEDESVKIYLFNGIILWQYDCIRMDKTAIFYGWVPTYSTNFKK